MYFFVVVKLCNAMKFRQYKIQRFSHDFILSTLFVIHYILAKCKNEQQLYRTVAVWIYVKNVIHQTSF